ncbi:uncharacterized protein DNG_06220 [Cephalotrichum gorgonifer]|uniref:Kinase n=1 Tax=Cephalotrichum gorgonifer TaxID=2041049 RepID=A0AAE8N2C8_9PEZI|nr:uncharacterized protein DNG_06220 [Cephalotrichum gorgonifer]
MHSMSGVTGLAMGQQHHMFPSDRSSEPNPLERLEWEIRALERQKTSRIYSHPLNSENLSVITALDSTDKASTPVPPTPDSAEDEERRARSDAKRRENRYSIGPEKMWSIGSGELGDAQDGHVEKSIAKAMTRAEPNNRSRKSSHTLGFFREGLPEEKAKRKDSKGGSQARVGGVAQPPVRVGSASDVIFEEPAESPESEKSLLHSPRKDMPQVVSRRPTLLVDTPTQPSEIDEEAIPSSGGGKAREEATGVALPPPSPATSNDESPRDAVDESPNDRPSSTDSTKVGTHHDEGDDSGEEKISSAFFLPHQDPERVEEERCGISEEGQLVPGRAQLRTQDRNRWLVKAGEPEPEDHTPPPTPPSSQSGRGALHPLSIPAGPATAMTCGQIAIVDEPEQTLPSPEKPISHPTLMYHDNYSAQEHNGQEAARRPLEAIELIPYKHQVGGHTPLWRFSKRAVCKKLNNRENEFYETVEHLHRDLLSFLPRYIGVLNVAFQKSPRRKSTAVKGDAGVENGAPPHPEGADERADQHQQDSGPRRVISQSFSTGPVQVPTVTFDDNRHIIPRNLLQPDLPPVPPVYRRSRTASGSAPSTKEDSTTWDQKRPSLADARLKSWGATIVNKRLRNEVFNNAFYEQPVDIQPHRKPHRRPLVPRPAIPHQPALKSVHSDSGLLSLDHPSAGQPVDSALGVPAAIQVPSRARLSDKPSHHLLDALDLRNTTEVKDVTGTSAPEPETIGESFLSQKRKRRYSGSGLRRKPQVGSEFRGDLKYYEEADQVTFHGDERHSPPLVNDKDRTTEPAQLRDEPAMIPGHAATMDDTVAAPPPIDFKIPRPVNPKEAQTKRDSRVEFFLLLEDLTAGMKRPCIMDLKMGTRQYGVDATPAKQLSQKGKCAKTTSLELGVRVCGLQVWDVATQSYIFRDKYEGRKIKAGAEFQEALTRFLYNGVDYHSVLRQIPTIIRKLDELARIARGLKGYRFYAASLLMFYDGEDADGGDAMVDDSTTDAATDAEDASVHRRRKRNKREVDFKIADFANSITATSDVADKACPPQYPDEPDRGFLRGLASLRRYFLKIQRDVRAEMGIEPSRTRYEEVEEEDGFVSE